MSVARRGDGDRRGGPDGGDGPDGDGVPATPDVALVSHLAYYRHAAVALHDAGRLERFVTAPLSPRPLPGARLPLVGPAVDAFDRERVDPDLAGVPMRRMWAAQAAARAVQAAASRRGRGTGLAARVRIWDLAVAAHLGRPGVVHAVSDLVGPGVHRARRRGAFLVCDVRSPHPATQRERVARLLARHGVAHRHPEDPIAARLEAAFAAADLLVANSELTRRSFLDRGWDPDRVVAVPPGCVVGRGDPGPAPAVFTVAFLARDRHTKGVLELVGAVRALRAPCRVVLAGAADPDLARALAAAGADVEFLGAVAPAEVPGVLARASVLALPSYGDGFGLVALEAMAAGRPVVVSDATGVADLVTAAGAGAVVPAGDADALGAALRQLQDDPDRAAGEGRRGRAAAAAASWSVYGRRLVAVYRDRVPG